MIVTRSMIFRVVKTRRARVGLRALTAAILIAGVSFASPVQAQRHHRDYHGRGHRSYSHHHDNTAAIIGGIIGLGLGAAIIGSMQQPPPPTYYYPPPPAYYPPYGTYPPPPPAVYYGSPY